MEAYHTGHHPLTARLRDILDSGELGRIERAEAVFCVPVPSRGNIRWKLELGGGGLLDVGYYPVRLLRDLFGEPTVRAAWARHSRGIDRYLEADLHFEPDVSARVVSSIWSRRLFSTRLRVRGDRGSMDVSWPYHPQYGARITVHIPAGSRRERVDRRSSYDFQLERFRDAVNGQNPCLTDTSAAVSQMHVLDEIYRASGLPERPSQT